ncbi:hypothetical protein Q8F55_002753 [Vanrija albida]|uniref:BTB domain-containing protein n=1 Tax=Vanrija albida TaxID=181172 RepID=A0ABR3QAS0_9TREE
MNPAAPTDQSASVGRSNRARVENGTCVEDDTPSIRDDRWWNKGDFSIISSDHVRFRIDHHYLLSASGFFRDLRDVASNADEFHELQLDDPFFETAPTVHNFLVVITEASIDRDIDVVEKLVPLGRFLTKYNCAAGMNVLLQFLRHAGTNSDRAIEWFVIGSSLDDVDLCADALEHYKYSWLDEDDSDDEERGPLDYVAGKNTLNPQTIPYARCRHIPPQYLWARSRDSPVRSVNCYARLLDEKIAAGQHRPEVSKFHIAGYVASPSPSPAP